ncbi:MAG: thiamine pyrophosphate-binding protein [Pseudomonadota bacterium]|nr:thiamine pyrophosphate-binding protein [Pseudomonadota bacterium]
MADRKPGPHMANPGRRGFLKGTTMAGAMALAAPLGAPLIAPGAAAAKTSKAPLRPSRLDEGLGPHPEDQGPLSSAGSDYMIDVLRHLGIDHVAFVPGDTFRGLHESLINYGLLTEPKMTYSAVNHEETAVAFCHGYAKVEGKPMACFVHATVGLQHAAMALYNAWADRVPVVCLVGARVYSAERGIYVDWDHSVFDGPALVRDFTKWDNTPLTLEDFGNATVRGYKFATTPPAGPVVLQVDMTLQENPLPGDRAPPIPVLPKSTPPSGDDAAVAEVAKLLVAAENPVIAADRAARTPEGLALMIALAEALQCAVVDSHARFNFPWRHPLNQSSRQREAVAEADLVLGLEMTDFHGIIGRLPKAVKTLSITSEDLYMKSNYGDYQHFAAVDLAVEADAQATLPALIEAVRRLTPGRRKSAFEARGRRLAEAHQTALGASREAAAVGWDEQPISVPRLCQELYGQIKDEDWALVSGTVFQSYWPQQLWAADRHYQYIGDAGAYGLGYLPGAALGAATAHAKHGRLAVAIGGDGDFLFSPAVMWAAAHNRIPLLYVIHNNRAYFNEIMALQRIANRRNRGIDRTGIGNDLTEPVVDYAALAKSMGVAGFGPVTDPKDLAAVFKQAIALVKKGEPVLVDVVAQGR